MPSTVKSKGESSFELVPPGTHYAVCTRVLNLGEQTTKFGSTPKHFIGFDVPAIRVEWEKDGVKHTGPAFIGTRYTSSLSPKAILRQHLEAWRGRAFSEEELAGFDLFNLLGVSAMLSVTHTEDGKYANIAAIMGMPPGAPQIVAESELLGYDPSSADANGVFAKLPEGFQKAIQRGQQPTAPAVPPPTATPPMTENPQGQVGYSTMPDGRPSAPVTGMVSPTPGPDDFDSDIPF